MRRHRLQNHIKNILCKVNDHAAEERHKSLRPLAGIVAFEGKADLHDAEAQQDCADGFDAAEHKSRSDC